MIRHRILATGIIAALLLSSCGETKKNISMDVSEPASSIAADNEESAKPTPTYDASTLEKFGEKLAPYYYLYWNESFDVSTENFTGDHCDTATVTIDAHTDIASNDVDQVFLFETIASSADNKEMLVRALFEDDIIYYDDQNHWPVVQLEQEIADANEELNICKEKLNSPEPMSGNDRNYYQANYNYILQNIDELTKLLENAPSDWIPATDFNYDMYCIFTDNNVKISISFAYELLYGSETQTESNLPLDMIYVSCYPLDKSAKTKTDEDCEKIANELINKLGLWEVCFTDKSCFIGSDSYFTETQVDKETGETCTYYFVRPYKYPGSTSLAASTYTFLFYEDRVSFGANLPVRLLDTVEDVPLLSFEEIKKIFKQELSDNAKKYEKEFYNSLKIWKIRLEHIYSKDSHAIIPAWSFYSRSQTGYTKDYPFLSINAMDGSIVPLDTSYYHSLY